MKKIGIYIGVIAVILVVVLISKGNITGNAVKSDVTIPLLEVTETAKFYEEDVDGRTISFFAVKASDGTIKTALNECDVCYASNKGYRQEGEDMVCNNCGNKYPILGLGTENRNPGGCWPSYLPNKISGDNLVVKRADLGKSKCTGGVCAV